MGRNEIRLRRKMMSSGRIARHRNYGELIARHEREVKIKRLTRLMIYFLLIAFFLIVFIIVLRWEKRESIRNQNEVAPTSLLISPQGGATYL